MLQQSLSRVGRIGFGVVLLSSLWSAQAQTNVSLYRYQISLRSGDFEYRDSIPAVVPPSGPYYKVETDRQGRIVRQTSMRSGKELATTQYDYQGAGKLYFRSEKFINGEQTGIEQVQRSASGIIVRRDDQTAQGVLTSYTVIKEASDPSEMEFYTYDASGKCVTHEKDAFDPNGVTIKAFTYPSPTSDAAHSEIEVDEHTGLVQSIQQFKGGKLDVSSKFTYGADGDILRRDGYRADNGKWYVGHEYSDGLESKVLYKYSDGSSKEVRFTYDEKRQNSKSEVYANDKPICTLTYDRLPDGTVKRTLATGPDGALLAEYPAPLVWEVQRSGQAIGRTDGILHKTGDWW
jgi:hypothetical protein